jgi:cell division protein FtsW (lipid II flippase)
MNPAQRFFFRSHALPRLHTGTWVPWCVALVLMCLLGSGLALQQALLWQRLAPAAADRYALDQLRLDTPIPPPMGWADLDSLCPAGAGLATWQLGAARRLAVARCLAEPGTLLDEQTARHEAGRLHQHVQAQLQAAEALRLAIQQQLAPQTQTLRAQLRMLQQHPGDPLTRYGSWLLQQPALRALFALPTSQRVPLPHEATDPDTAGQWEALIRRTQAASAQARALPLREQLVPLALLASGLAIERDYGDVPATARLVTQRDSLAASLERQRRAQWRAQQGFSLAGLQSVPWALLSSVAVLLAGLGLASAVGLNRVRRATWAHALAWPVVGALLCLGALVLSDLALTADPALRYLADRQYLHFSAGASAWPLTVSWQIGGLEPLRLWWPLLAVAGMLVVLCSLHPQGSLWLAPVRAWLDASSSPRRGWLPVVTLLAMATALLWLVGLAAAVSEGLMFLGAVGLATVMARQAALLNARGDVPLRGLIVAIIAVLCAAGGAVLRGDLGHALVAAGVATAFVALAGHRAARWALLAGLLAAAGLLGFLALAGTVPEWGAWLPPHAQDRLQAWLNPLGANASDIARVHWLVEGAGGTGWGLGYVPWQGLSRTAAHQGLPLQGPSDYVLGLTTAVWGLPLGVAAVGTLLMLMLLAAAVALRTAARPGIAPEWRFLASLGAWGCLLMAFKALLSLGGVSGVLPLTGLPVALLGYGPVTLFAALVYLGLALGSAHVYAMHQPAVHWTAAHPAAPSGPLRQRIGLGLGVAVMGLVLLGVAAAWALQRSAGAGGQVHTSQSRWAVAQALTRSLVPAGMAPAAARPSDSPTAPICEHLSQVLQAWNQQLSLRASASHHPRAWQVDTARLLHELPLASPAECRQVARQLGTLLQSGGLRTLAPANDTITRAPQPRWQDYSTQNAWWGLPGSLLATTAAGTTPVAADDPFALLQDPWLQRELAPRLHAALRQPASWVQHHVRRVPVGPQLALSLDAHWQPLAQRVADCFTGRRHGAECDTATPADPGWRARFAASPDSIRAGALGLVVLDVDSGRIVALSGALSDCTRHALARPAQTDASGRTPALLPGQACAQLPDARSAWLVDQHPALWAVPPGSALKPLAFAAGADAAVLSAALSVPAGAASAGAADTTDAHWLRILARSDERLPVQRAALAAGPRYLDALRAPGYGGQGHDILWGLGEGSSAAATHWRHAAPSGTQGLRAVRMSLDEAERIRADKQAGQNVDARLGSAVMAEFVAARRLADTSVGGADLRVDALALATLWQGLDRRARGLDDAPAPHVARHPLLRAETRPLHALSVAAARRTLKVTAGVTASAAGGTAQGSCRLAMGSCPATGWPTLSGKTGSADFLAEEDSPWVKAGQQLPAKLFGAVFTGADGRRYAIAAMGLRVRQGASHTLELSASAPAEAVLIMARHMMAPPARP